MSKAKAPRAPSLAKKGPRASEGRKANGRFDKGTSGNPNGRPRKELPSPHDALLRVANREITLEDGSTVSMADLLAARTFNAALTDPKMGLRLMMLLASMQAAGGGMPVDQIEDDDLILQGIMDRARRQVRAAGAPSETEVGVNDAEDGVVDE